jgi:hypothetical protein
MEHESQAGDPGTRRFRIWVRGSLHDGFSEGLAGIEQEDVPAGTTLSGVLLDQSQLHSTLDLLRSLGIEVLRFEVDPPRDSTRLQQRSPLRLRAEEDDPVTRMHRPTDPARGPGS